MSEISFNDLIADFYIYKQEQNRLDNIKSNIINEFIDRLSKYIIDNKLKYTLTKIDDSDFSLLEIKVNDYIINSLNNIFIYNIGLVRINLGTEVAFNYNKDTNIIYCTIHNSNIQYLYKKD